MDSSRRQFLARTSAVVLGNALLGHRARAYEPAAAPASADSLVASVRLLGNQFLDNNVGVTGADGATSTVLPSGNALWMFGDTVEGPFKSIRGLDLTRLRSNTGAIVPKQHTANGIKTYHFLADETGKRPRQIVPFAADEDPAINRVWAVHGMTIPPHTYLFYHRITLLKGVDVFLNFQLDGMGIARADAGDLNFSRLSAPDGTRLFWKPQEPTFGVFTVRAEDYVYLWGCLVTGMHLARTRPGSIENLASYEYLVEAPTPEHPLLAPRWSKQFQPTGALFESVPNEMSAAFNAHLQKYVAFHSLNRENKIVLRTATQLTGPWSAPQVVYRPEQVTNDDLIYAAKEHPELARDGGRVLYVTFVNSATYVPQLIEVTLK
ncbi:MAG TPA: DUF4185 domain-containing protein [Lacipirellulaceae bacterium]|nr:DUF4185 domain-containing protein [Lacipirellulaceae bacterium]